MKISCKYFFLVVVVMAGVVSAQVATGTPPFGSFGGGPFDMVNLGNLNVHFAIPVLHKAGRGVPFTYDLSYDSSVWSPVTSSGTMQWQPVNNWGWRGATEITTGYLSHSTSLVTVCTDPPSPPVKELEFSNWVYHDPFGTSHPFPGFASAGSTTCGIAAQSMNAQASDSSGYTLTTNALSNATITSAGGKVALPPVNITSGSGTFTDTNGNQINVNTSGQFFDTLSSTVPVLTVSSAAPPTATTFTYTAPSNGNAVYNMNYLQYTVKTNFVATGISEYGPTTNSLVSNVTLPDGSSYSFTYEHTPGSCTPNTGTQPACITGRIASVTLPTGGVVTYTYSGVNNGIEADGSTAGLTRQLSPGGQWQYSRTAGTTAKLWTTTVTDPNSNQAVINFSEDNSTTNPSQNFYETQRVVNQLINGTQTPLVTVTKCYNAVYASCATAAVSSPITQTDVYSQFPGGNPRLSEVTYNTFGLVTDAKEYDFGVNTGAAPNTKLIRETAISYAPPTNGIASMRQTVVVNDWTSGTASTLSSTTLTYDEGTPTATSGTPQHISVTGAHGNLTTVSMKVSSGILAKLSKSFTYYDTGTPNVATDVNGAQTTFVYGSSSCGNSFVTSITEPLGLSRSIAWNCTGGMATQVTDENGQVVKSDYTDPNFWRPADVFDQENNETTITYNGHTAVEAALTFNGGSSISDSLTTVDGFGRPIFAQRKQGPTVTTYDTAETDYNSLGQSSRSTMPYAAAANPTSSNTTAPAVNATYDALGRVLTVTDADGGTASNTYTNNDVLQKVSGTQTFQKQFEYDGLGRLTSVCEISATLPGVAPCRQGGPTGYLTQYTYDALGDLLTVTQNAQAATTSQETRAFTYDMLGRMLTESNPETGNGGTNGTVTYTYDRVSPCGGAAITSNGDLVQKKDNAGNTTCYSYDVLHRVLQAGNSSVSNTILRKFFYDSESSYPTNVTVVNGKTSMVEAQTVNTSNLSTPVTDEFFSYSPRGEVTDVYESTPHSGGFYHTTASYHPTGALYQLSGIPSVPTILYGFTGTSGSGLDGEGRYTRVAAVTGPDPVPFNSVTYSTNSATAPLGALTSVAFGSGDSDSFTYDPNTGRMAGYTFSVNGKTDNGALTWNPNGTLQKLVINDQIPGTSDSQTCNYAYDDLQRSSSVGCGSAWSQTFTYDAFGNSKKSGSLSFLPVYTSTTNQFASIPSVTVKYDANGNLLTDNLNNTYTWDPNSGNPASINGTVLIYDALGQMVEQQNGSAFTQVLYSPVGKTALMNGQTLVKAFVQLPGGATAIYNSSGIASYRHTDWLGTSRLTSTQARGLFSSSASAPFGEQYAVSGTADASFTGQNSDTVSSLYDFTFREHSPSQGRWISPDPLGPGAVDPGNPQSWNRYEYVSNNPLALIDPLGLDDSSPIFTFYSIVTLTEVDVFGTYSHLFDGSSFFSGALRKSPHARFQGELRGGSGAANCTPLTPGCSNVPTAQQQQTKDCMGDWSNSPLGKGVQFLSLNNLANNITSLKTWAEWTALPAGKMLTLTATNNLSQAIGNTEFLSVTGGTSTVVTAPTAAGIETTEAVGAELAPLAILGATVTDMRVQAHCEGFDVPMALRGPG